MYAVFVRARVVVARGLTITRFALRVSHIFCFSHRDADQRVSLCSNGKAFNVAFDGRGA